MPQKRLLNTPLDVPHTIEITVDGRAVPVGEGELLVEVLNRAAALANLSIADAGFHAQDRVLSANERRVLQDYYGTRTDKGQAERHVAGSRTRMAAPARRTIRLFGTKVRSGS